MNDILDLMVEVQHHWIPGSAPVDPDARQGEGIKSHRSVITEQVVDLLDFREKDMEPDDLAENFVDGEWRLGVFPTLAMWVSLVHVELVDLGENPAECCPDARHHTLAGEIAWLDRYADRVLDLHDDFERQIRSIRQALRTACRTTDAFQPTCTKCGNDMDPQYAEGESGDIAPPWWVCTACGWTVIHDAEVRRLALTQPPMTLRQIHRITHIPLRTLHNWRAEKRFLPIGKSKRGGDLFDLALIERAAKSEEKRRKGRAS